MLRRNFFVVVVMLGLILSAAFTSWTQGTSIAGNSAPAIAKSWPPDLTNYARPATAHDIVSTKGVSGVSSPGFTVVEVPESGGGEPDIAINPLNPKQIVIHAGFGGWNGNAPNFISSDGGVTWTTSNQIPNPPGAGGSSGCPCDSAEDYGLDGNLYGSFLTFSPTDVYSPSNTNPFANLFAYFLSGGNAVRTSFNGTAGNVDQPQLLTDRDPTTASQTNTYVAYDDDGGNNLRVSAAFGTVPPNFTVDNVSGVTFGGGVNQGHRIAVDSRTGAIYSLYQVCLANCGATSKTIGYKLNRSLDAGTTWTLNASATGIQVASGVTVQPQPKFGTVNALLGGIDHAAVNPSTGHVFVVFGDDNGTIDPTTGVDGNAVFIQEVGFDNSTPTNASVIGSPHQVSLPGAEAALPSVAVAPNGTIGVLYTSFDGFSVDGFPIFSGHFAISKDAGATFTDNNLLTFLSPSKDNGNSRQRVLGDYQRVKAVSNPASTTAGATFYGVFTGNGAALGESVADNDAIFFKVVADPQINVNPNPLAIGPVCEGSTGTGELDVSNTAADTLTITGITKSSGSPDISLAPGPTFPVSVLPGASFSFSFNCTPTTFGAKSATFAIASNDSTTPSKAVTVNCSTASGAVVLTGSGDFGTASCTGSLPPAQTIKVDNVGGCNLNLLGAAITSCPGGDFKLVNPPTFPVAISPDSGIDLNVKFTPSSAGSKSCTLTVTTDDPIHPTATIPLTGTTPTGTASLAFPTGLTFPPTVIQQDAACSSTLGVPVANNGACPVTVTAVGLTQTSVTPPGLDYSLTGIAGLPPNLTIPPGGQLGAGDLNLVFAPFAVAQFSKGTVDVTYINDPITLATTTTHVPFCGEGVNRGLRVLVTSGGVPVTSVKQIQLTSALGPEQPNGGAPSVKRTVKNAALTTIAAAFPCPGIAFHAEFGGLSKQVQLKDGEYKIRVTLKVGGKTKVKVVRVLMDQCSFTPNVVVAF